MLGFQKSGIKFASNWYSGDILGIKARAVCVGHIPIIHERFELKRFIDEITSDLTSMCPYFGL